MLEAKNATVCKTLIHRFDSDPHLQKTPQNQYFSDEQGGAEFPLIPCFSLIFPPDRGKKAGNWDRSYDRWFATAMGGSQ